MYLLNFFIRNCSWSVNVIYGKYVQSMKLGLFTPRPGRPRPAAIAQYARRSPRRSQVRCRRRVAVAVAQRPGPEGLRPARRAWVHLDAPTTPVLSPLC